MHQVLWPADYLVLSGALGKPCTIVIYSQGGLPNYSMPDMHTAILYSTSSTADDQAVNTVLVQLGAARHLTRPLTPCIMVGL